MQHLFEADVATAIVKYLGMDGAYWIGYVQQMYDYCHQHMIDAQHHRHSQACRHLAWFVDLCSLFIT